MKSKEENILYFDHNATTPLAPEAKEAMMPYMQEQFGNPSSGYLLGSRAKEAVELARRQTAALVGALPDEICFTSGGSESNNFAVKGIVDFTRPSRCHIITSAIEHPAILNPLLYLMELGVDVTIAPVDGLCRVDPDFIRRAVKPETRLITVMLANNETGTIQPVKEIASVAAEKGVLFHTDAAQAVGKIPVDVKELGVDFLSIAGHKLYGPKGIGALFIKRGRSLTPLVHGASQEMGKRAGTESVILEAGLGAACERAGKTILDDMALLSRLRDRLQDILSDAVKGLVVNGHILERLPNTLHVSVPGLEGAKILEGIPRLLASTGAACHDRSVKLSHVLSAMGIPPKEGMGALRLTIGRTTAEKDIEEAAGLLIEQIRRLRGGKRQDRKTGTFDH